MHGTARRLTALFSRRDFLSAMLGTSAGAIFFLTGCSTSSVKPFELPPQTPTGSLPTAYGDSVDALWDVLLPAERDLGDAVLVPGAREVGIDTVLVGENLLRTAIDLGLLPRMPDATIALFDDFAGQARGALNQALDALAQLEKPLATFSSLSREAQERIVEHGFADDRLGPLFTAARAVCFLAFLGAITSDAGLTTVGFPPFEDFAAGRAVSGYPRMTNGKLDDYTYNRAPAATVGDDLSMIVDQNGDLR